MGKLLAITGPWLAFLVAALISTPDAKAAAPPPRPLSLDEVLSGWARSNDAMRSMRVRFTKTESNRRSVKGEVRLIRPDLLRIDEETSQGRTTILFTKDRIHWFTPTDKTERIFLKPLDTKFLGEKTTRPSALRNLRGFLMVAFQDDSQQWTYWLYAGLPAQDLSRQCYLRLAKEDASYIYLDIKPPKSVGDRFQRMRVVLRKDDFRVRQIWYQLSNEYEVTLDFEKVEANPKMTSESIREGLPEDWDRINLREVDGTPEKRGKE
jgi:outer membrane lipoprotein-sorting protein